MKKYIRILLVALVCLSCREQEDKAIIIVASMLPSEEWKEVYQENMPQYIIRENERSQWRFLYGGIDGFVFETGYECTLEVSRMKWPEGYMDVQNPRLSLIRVISKVAKNSDVPESLIRPGE